MTNDEAQQAIFTEWASWRSRKGIATRLDNVEASMFYLHLETAKPELLDIECSAGDRWRVVRGWLLSAHMLTD